jgi:hypothetical protein
VTVNDGRPEAKAAITLTSDQRCTTDRARAFLTAASEGTSALAEHLQTGPVENAAQFYATDGFGVARHHVAELLGILASLTAADRRQPSSMSACGPFETEQQVRGTPTARAVYEAFDRDHGPGKMAPHVHRILDEACTEAGLELGAYDHQIVLWLAGWGPQTAVVVAGLITRAREAGEAARR